ncbi:MAG: hypothetical protein WCF57_09850 [Pyrinomonadaceae bacterium]
MGIGFARRWCCRLRLRYVFILLLSVGVPVRLAFPGERLDEHSIDLLVESTDHRHNEIAPFNVRWVVRLSPGARI